MSSPAFFASVLSVAALLSAAGAAQAQEEPTRQDERDVRDRSVDVRDQGPRDVRDQAPRDVRDQGPRDVRDPRPSALRESVEELIDEEASDPRVTLPYRGQVVPADRTLTWGAWTFSAFLSETVTWDDNVNLTEDDTDDDVISTTTLGVTAARQGVDLATSITASIFHEAHSRDSDLDSNGGSLSGSARMDFGRRYLEFTDTLSQSEDSRSSVDGPGTTRVIVARRRTKQLTNSARLTGGYSDGPMTYQLTAGHSFDDYDKSLETSDSEEWSANALLGRELSPTVSLNVQADYSSVEYDSRSSDDYTSIGWFVGFGWEATPQVSASGRIGYTRQDIDERRPGEDDFSGGTGNFGVTYRATPKVTLSADYARDLFAGTSSGSEAIQVLGLGAAWAIDPLWSADARAGIQETEPSRGRDSRTYDFSVGVSYRVSERFNLRLRYEHTREDSDAAGADYVNNRVSLSASFLF